MNFWLGDPTAELLGRFREQGSSINYAFFASKPIATKTNLRGNNWKGNKLEKTLYRRVSFDRNQR